MSWTSGNFSKVYNDDVKKVFDFVNYTRPVANRLIKIYNNRKEGYSKFRWGRFVEKTVDLSAPIKKSNFTQFFWLSIKQNKKSKTASHT